MDPRLREAAQTGNIDVLYSLIQEDPYILERIDQVPFIDTPLHIAAVEGHVNFASEMMILKASFAKKLNRAGLTPMHLALKNEKTKLVLRLLRADKELVRVKGREGMTPLHYVAKMGNSNLLVDFLEDCPECIEDVTVQEETALHLALKNEQIEAFNLLVGWLQRNRHKRAMHWESEIVNQKDNDDNTVLHIAAIRKQRQAINLLLNCALPFDTNVKNSEGLTALEILKNANREVIITGENETRKKYYLKPNFSCLERQIILFARMKKSISVDLVNSLLVISALIIAATYQSSLSPPGGVWQNDNISSNSNVTHLVHTTSSNFFLKDILHGGSKKPGTTIMSSGEFFLFWLLNGLTLWITLGATAWLIPTGPFLGLMTPLYYLGLSYQYSMTIISPSRVMSTMNCFFFFIFGTTLFLLPLLLLRPNLARHVRRIITALDKGRTDILQTLGYGNNATMIQRFKSRIFKLFCG
ncbi:hypothetical protein REPUB_Repub13aG0071900 [Reevesia pubescens]